MVRAFSPRAARVELPVGAADAAYLWALDATLPGLLEAAAPDLLLQGGVDVLAGDRFGRLALTEDGVVAGERRVAAWCREAGVPLATTLGGGYHLDPERTFAAHATGLLAVAETLGAARTTC